MRDPEHLSLVFSTPDVLLVLRLVVIGIVYLFLIQLVRLLWRDLRAVRRESSTDSASNGCLIVMESDVASLVRGTEIRLFNRSPVGRSPANLIVVDDDFVSAEHAVLVWRNGHWWVQDLGSTNGTLLNGRPVTTLTKMGWDDVLDVGRVRFGLAR